MIKETFTGSGEPKQELEDRALETFDMWAADRSAQGREAPSKPAWYTEIKVMRDELGSESL